MAAKDGGDPAPFRVPDAGVLAAVLGREPVHSAAPAQAAPDLKINPNIAASTVGLIKYLRDDPRLWWGALVASWFWLVGAVVLSMLPPLVKNVLGGNEEVVTLFLTIFSVSIAIGSGLAAWLADGRIVLLPTLIGGVLLGLFAHRPRLDHVGDAASGEPDRLSRIVSPSRAASISRIDLAGLAIAGGLFIVPTFAAVQAWAGADRRARVVAAVNVLNAAFMAVGAVVFGLLQTLGMTRRRCCSCCSASPISWSPSLIAPHHADERAQRCALHHLPRAFPDRGEGRSRTSTMPATTPSSRSTM